MVRPCISKTPDPHLIRCALRETLLADHRPSIRQHGQPDHHAAKMQTDPARSPPGIREDRIRPKSHRRPKPRRRGGQTARNARARRIRLQRWMRLLLASLGFAAVAAAWHYYNEPAGEDRSGPIALCSASQQRNCIIDGDTGRDRGQKWRLVAIDAPEISEPGCERERMLAIAARNRLQGLLAGGYRIRPAGRTDPHGRNLIDLELPDGRDVSRILLNEGLAQRWPNRGNTWCEQ